MARELRAEFWDEAEKEELRGQDLLVLAVLSAYPPPDFGSDNEREAVAFWCRVTTIETHALSRLLHDIKQRSTAWQPVLRTPVLGGCIVVDQVLEIEGGAV